MTRALIDRWKRLASEAETRGERGIGLMLRYCADDLEAELAGLAGQAWGERLHLARRILRDDHREKP